MPVAVTLTGMLEVPLSNSKPVTKAAVVEMPTAESHVTLLETNVCVGPQILSMPFSKKLTMRRKPELSSEIKNASSRTAAPRQQQKMVEKSPALF